MSQLSVDTLERRPKGARGREEGDRRQDTASDDPRITARRRRILLNGVITGAALVLLLAYLMPLGYGGVTSLKTKAQASEANSPVLPTEVVTLEHEGRTYDVYEVPFDDGVRELALVDRGREASTFLDPDAPAAGPIEWDGRWRTLEPVRELSPQWRNYPDAWTRISFLRLLGWTLFYALTTMVATVVSSSIVAYGFARFRFPGRGLFFGLLLSTIILPPAVTLVPTYAFFVHIGWIGTYLPLIVPQLFANAYNVFLLRQYFLTIPRELEEAARVDGAGPIRTFTKVILPNSVPALVAVSLFHFFFAWNDFFGPLIYLAGNLSIVPISVGLTFFNGVYSSEPQLILAAAVLTIGLPLLIFFFAQRVFVRGIVITGVDK
jgi:multiple sugar transport system permease protein